MIDELIDHRLIVNYECFKTVYLLLNQLYIESWII